MSSKLWKGLLPTMQLSLVLCVFFNRCASQNKDGRESGDAENWNTENISQVFKHRSRQIVSSVPESVHCWVDYLNIISWTFNLWHTNVFAIAVSEAHIYAARDTHPELGSVCQNLNPTSHGEQRPPLLWLDVTIGCSLDLVLWFLSNPVAVW